MALRARNKLLLAKIQPTPGLDAAPTPGADAVAVEKLMWKLNPNLVNTDEHTGGLDGSESIVGGTTVQVTFDVNLRGGASPGAAPQWGKLLRACGFSETVTATQIPAGGAEACGDGGTTTAAVLGASAAATAQIYRGMPVELTGDVAAVTQILSYAADKTATLAKKFAAALDSGADWRIPPHVLYRPISAAVPMLTLWLYEDGKLLKVTDAKGTVSFNFSAGGVWKASFTLSGLLGAQIDAAMPDETTVHLDAVTPPVWRGGLMEINRSEAPAASLSFQTGGDVQYPDNPNAAQGVDGPDVMARAITGSVDPNAALVATRDALGEFLAGTAQIFAAATGSAAGNRIAVCFPAAKLTNLTPGDRKGLQTMGHEFEAKKRDAGVFIAVY